MNVPHSYHTERSKILCWGACRFFLPTRYLPTWCYAEKSLLRLLSLVCSSITLLQENFRHSLFLRVHYHLRLCAMNVLCW